MKRTVEITSRYQPVIDFYKGYNNAEFNVLTTNLLCSYKMLKQEKNLDLLLLIECLKGYSINLPELMALISEKFENIPQEKIKEMEESNLSQEAIDMANIPKEKKPRKPRTIKNSSENTHFSHEQPVYQQPVYQQPPVQQQMYNQPMYAPQQGVQYVYSQPMQGVPVEMNGQQQQIVMQQPIQQTPVQQPVAPVKQESKPDIIQRRKFNILSTGIDLSDGE